MVHATENRGRRSRNNARTSQFRFIGLVCRQAVDPVHEFLCADPPSVIHVKDNGKNPIQEEASRVWRAPKPTVEIAAAHRNEQEAPREDRVEYK